MLSKSSPLPKLLKQVEPHILRVQRNFPYPIKSEIHRITPIETLPTDSAAASLVVLTQHKTFTESLWTIYTWLYFMRDRLALKLAVNGDVTVRQKQIFLRLFPNGEIANVTEWIDSQTLAYPTLRRFYESHKFGKLLLIKLALHQQSNILFSDPDVLVFQKPTEIMAAMDAKQGCYFAELNAFAISSWIRDRAKQLSLKLTKDFNAGVLYIPQNSISLELCETLLEGWTPAVMDYFPEQTICDVLMTAMGATRLPPEEYVVNSVGMQPWHSDIDYSAVKVRHFVGNVRQRMYTRGYPLVKQLLGLI
jgi:hypothetical protein